MMRHIGMAGVLAASWIGSVAAASEAPLGTWITEEKDSKVRISTCGKALCATVAWAKTGGSDENNPNPALRSRSLVGLDLSRDFKPDGKGGWAGSIYNPDNGKTYAATLQPRGARELEVGGCVLGGLLCGSETWQRAPDSTASVTTR